MCDAPRVIRRIKSRGSLLCGGASCRRAARHTCGPSPPCVRAATRIVAGNGRGRRRGSRAQQLRGALVGHQQCDGGEASEQRQRPPQQLRKESVGHGTTDLRGAHAMSAVRLHGDDTRLQREDDHRDPRRALLNRPYAEPRHTARTRTHVQHDVKHAKGASPGRVWRHAARCSCGGGDKFARVPRRRRERAELRRCRRRRRRRCRRLRDRRKARASARDAGRNGCAVGCTTNWSVAVDGVVSAPRGAVSRTLRHDKSRPSHDRHLLRERARNRSARTSTGNGARLHGSCVSHCVCSAKRLRIRLRLRFRVRTHANARSRSPNEVCYRHRPIAT